MVENYSLTKSIPMLNIEINITVEDRDLLIELDDNIRGVLIEHYGLNKIKME